jgi:hypothetical protein
MMGLWSWLFGGAACEADRDDFKMAALDVNPATGLPMMDDVVDVMGNPYGLGNPGGMIGAADDGDTVHSSGGHIGSPFDDFI